MHAVHSCLPKVPTCVIAYFVRLAPLRAVRHKLLRVHSQGKSPPTRQVSTQHFTGTAPDSQPGALAPQGRRSRTPGFHGVGRLLDSLTGYRLAS
jgi:hypothetical protein